MTRRVVVTDFTFPGVAQERLAAEGGAADFSAHQASTAGEVAAVVAGADVIVVQFAPFGEEAAAAVKPGATVIRYGVGYDNIDLTAAKRAGLRVGFVPDYCADEVADHTAAAALALLRKLPNLDASVRGGEWSAVRIAKPLKPFSETVFGFLGLGRIGQSVRARLAGFGFPFIAADPGLDDARAAEAGVRLVDEDELLRSADILSLHAPATPATVGFLNAARLARMQSHAMIVNTARGSLIVEEDLAYALKSGAIGGAAIDVFHEEPLPADSPLRDAPNLLLTPHAAWYSEAAIDRLQGLVAEDIGRALAGEPPRRPVAL